VRLPAADELFRHTGGHASQGGQGGGSAEPQVVELAEAHALKEQKGQHATKQTPPARTPSGRVKHDEKMTIYVTADELLDVEHARLELRRSHGLAVDRGRLVRAAVAMALADLDANGADSALVTRLNEA
jgi:hypothetical protein